MNERPILIIGCPRSGTTFFRDLLRSHPRLSFPPESNVLPALWRLHGDPRDERAARNLASDLLGAFSIESWGLSLTPGDLADHRSFRTMVAALYERWAANENKARWGDKTPLHAVELPTALEIFPEAQVIHVIRDGRDVAASLIRQPWGPTRALSAARLWRRCVEGAIGDGRPLGPGRYLEIRFEQLVAEPEPVLREVCRFLGESFEAALLRPSRIPTPQGLAPPWRPEQDAAIDPSVVGRWRAELSERDLAAFETEAGPLLRELGYRSTASARRIGAAERLACRAADASGFLRWRLTTWDRVPRARTTLLLARRRLARGIQPSHRLGEHGG